MKIAVYIQTNDNKISPMSLESLVAAQKIKKETNGQLHAVIFNKDLSNELSNYQCDSIMLIDDPNVKDYSPLHFIESFDQINNNIKPNLFVFGHSYETRDWVPRLSAKLDIPFLADCISFNFSDSFQIVRPIYQAKLNQEIKLTSEQSIVSFQAGSFNVEDIEKQASNIETISVDFSSVSNCIRPGEKFQENAGGVDLTSADIIVSVGRGIAKEENIPMAEDLSKKLNAQIGSSRPIVDAGWLDHSRQIGSSGQTVSPKLYFSVGISGAIQHLVGMKGSKNIIAINKDPNAPIFEIADYAVIGDVLEIIPKLNENL